MFRELGVGFSTIYCATPEKMSAITATTWVPRGYAATFPTKYVFDDEEYARIAKLAKLQLEDAQDDLDEAQAESETAQSQREDRGSNGVRLDAQGVQSNG